MQYRERKENMSWQNFTHRENVVKNNVFLNLSFFLLCTFVINLVEEDLFWILFAVFHGNSHANALGCISRPTYLLPFALNSTSLNKSYVTKNIDRLNHCCTTIRNIPPLISLACYCMQITKYYPVLQLLSLYKKVIPLPHAMKDKIYAY